MLDDGLVSAAKKCSRILFLANDDTDTFVLPNGMPTKVRACDLGRAGKEKNRLRTGPADAAGTDC